MSKIDELIQELCPNGVEYKELGAVEDSGIIKLGRGNVISKTDIVGSPGDYPVYSSSAAGSGEFGRYGKYMFDDERITWSIDGGGRFFYRTAHKYSVTNVSGWLKVIKIDILDIKFLYYVLTDIWKTKAYDYTKKAHPSIIRNEYIIPIPPLPIQQEIVRILDNFTKLEAELEAELEARKKQYEYYRNQLLTPIEIDGKWFINGKEAKWKALGDVCKFMNGKGHEKFINEEGSYIVVNSKFISTEGKVKKYSIEQLSPVYKDDLLMVMSDLPNGRALAKCYIVEADNKYTLNQRICALSVKITSEVNSKYLFYACNRNNQLLRFDNGADQTNLRKDDILKILIPIPPFEEQERITAILDIFDALVNDISFGLPAEIVAMRKQYEYYRGKLLTFQNKAEAQEA